jgi:hypothetical protein
VYRWLTASSCRCCAGVVEPVRELVAGGRSLTPLLASPVAGVVAQASRLMANIFAVHSAAAGAAAGIGGGGSSSSSAGCHVPTVEAVTEEGVPASMAGRWTVYEYCCNGELAQVLVGARLAGLVAGGAAAAAAAGADAGEAGGGRCGRGAVVGQGRDVGGTSGPRAEGVSAGVVHLLAPAACGAPGVSGGQTTAAGGVEAAGTVPVVPVSDALMLTICSVQHSSQQPVGSYLTAVPQAVSIACHGQQAAGGAGTAGQQHQQRSTAVASCSTYYCGFLDAHGAWGICAPGAGSTAELASLHRSLLAAAGSSTGGSAAAWWQCSSMVAVQQHGGSAAAWWQVLRGVPESSQLEVAMHAALQAVSRSSKRVRVFRAVVCNADESD